MSTPVFSLNQKKKSFGGNIQETFYEESQNYYQRPIYDSFSSSIKKGKPNNPTLSGQDYLSYSNTNIDSNSKAKLQQNYDQNSFYNNLPNKRGSFANNFGKGIVSEHKESIESKEIKREASPGKLNQQIKGYNSSYDFYFNYLENVRSQHFQVNQLNLEENTSSSNININNQNLQVNQPTSNLSQSKTVSTKTPHNVSKHVQDRETKENNDPQLNESISTTNTGITANSPRGIYNRSTLKSIYDNYLEVKYPEISNIQKKFSQPYSKIEVKKNSTYFIIKSFNIENIHKAIKYGVWSTTYSGNILFDKAYSLAQSRNADVYLFFSTNSTFAFQGIARLKSKFQSKSYNFWKGSDKYKSFNGSFMLDWLIIKDVPNATLDKIQINNIPFSKLRNGVEINEHDALSAVSVYESFYYCSSLVLSDFMRLDFEEKQMLGPESNSRKMSSNNAY